MVLGRLGGVVWPASSSGAGWLSVGRSSGVVGLAVLEAGEHAEVSYDGGAGDHEEVLGAAEQPAPASSGVGGGGVFDGGEAAFGAAAAVVGTAVSGRGVVVFLPGFGVDGWRHGDRGLGAAAGWFTGGRAEDLGPVKR